MKLYAHQKQALSLAVKNNLILQHDCGTGKTLTALKIIEYYKQKGIGPTLVVCPVSIIEAAWIQDAEQFTPNLSIVSLWQPSGPKKAAKQKALLQKQYDIYVANYETFKALFQQLQEKGFKILIVDESSKMKNYKSQITKSLLAFAGIHYRTKGGRKFRVKQTIPHRYCLSGTPAPNGQDEYWPQVKFITGPGDKVFPDNYYAFRGYYFYNIFQNAQNTLAQKWVLRKDKEEEFNHRLSRVVHVVRKEDAVDLPEKVYEVRNVRLTDTEMDAHQSMLKALVLEFKGWEVLAANAMAKIMKLRQITSGFCYTNSGEVLQIGRSKFRELDDLLTEIGNRQVIIWANFHSEIEALEKRYPRSVSLWSGTPGRQKAIDAFLGGDCQYLIANPASAGHGLTFTNCRDAVYLSVNYSYELQEQSENRIHRIGQQGTCTYYFLLARQTIDEVIYKAVRKKFDINQTIRNFLREFHDDKRTDARDRRNDSAEHFEFPSQKKYMVC